MKKRIMAMLMTAILVIASVPFTAFAEEMPAEVLGGEVMEAVAAEAAEAEAIPTAAGEEAEAAAEVTETSLAGAASVEWGGLQNAIDVASPSSVGGVFDVLYEEGTGIKILKLLKNITAESGDTYLNVPDDSKLILDLNEKTLDRGLAGGSASSNGNVIKVGQGASLTVKNGTITGSWPTSAGALLCQSSTDGTMPGPKELNVINVNFTGCNNGVISLYDVEHANIENCTFTGNANKVSNGGAININAMNSSETKKVTIMGCLFENNKVESGSGSAICIFGKKVDNVPYADVTIKDSKFTGNVAGVGSGEGGAICAYRVNSVVLDGCTITGNSSLANNSCGGFTIGAWSDQFIIKGKTIIKDNTCGGKPADMCLREKNKSKFKTEGLASDAEIGIVTGYEITEGQSYVISDEFNADEKKCFFPDDSENLQLSAKAGKLTISPKGNFVEVEYNNDGTSTLAKEKLLNDEGTLTLPDQIPDKNPNTRVIGVNAVGNVDVTVHGNVNNDYFEQSGIIYASETGVQAVTDATVTVEGFVKNTYKDGVTAKGNAIVTVAGCVDGEETGVIATDNATVTVNGENAADAIRGHGEVCHGVHADKRATVTANGNVRSEGYVAILIDYGEGTKVNVNGNAIADGNDSEYAVQIQYSSTDSVVMISKDAIVPEGGFAVDIESVDPNNTVMIEGTAGGSLNAEGGKIFVGKLDGKIRKGEESIFYLIGLADDGAGLEEFDFSGVAYPQTGLSGKSYNSVCAANIAGATVTITPKTSGKKVDTGKLRLPAGVTKVEENGALILKFDANFKGGLQNMVLTFGDGPRPDPTPSSDDSEPLFTGTWNNPVKNGAWKQDANGIWSYTTTQVFRNTWGYIENPYAGAGQNKADWFYFDQYGHMLTGWQWILWKGELKCFYLNPTKDGTLGACLLGPGKTPDGYEIDASGAWTGK